MIFVLGDTTHFFVQRIFPSKINWKVTVQMLHGGKWIILHIIIADFKNHTSYDSFLHLWREGQYMRRQKKYGLTSSSSLLWSCWAPVNGLAFVALILPLCFRLRITELFSLGKVTMVGWSETVDTELFSIGLIYSIPIHSSPSSWETEFPI